MKQLARLLFWGIDPSREPETQEIWGKWHLHFETFLSDVDYRYGNLLRLPFPQLSSYRQPAKTTQVRNVIHSVYLKKKQEENSF